MWEREGIQWQQGLMWVNHEKFKGIKIEDKGLEREPGCGEGVEPRKGTCKVEATVDVAGVA